MNYLPDYLLKLSFGLGLIWLFYYVALRRLTFYNWNRWYLLLYALVAFVIPLVNLDQALTPQSLAEIPIIRSVPAIPSATTVETWHATSEGSEKHLAADANTTAEVDKPPLLFLEGWLIGLFALGAAFMLLRFAVQLVAFYKIKHQARLVSDEWGVKIYHVERPIVPFSFGKAIFFNPKLHTPQELRQIIDHETVHVNQRHTPDVLFAEMLCVLNWYNPFAWLIRHAIRQNLEFIADRQVLNNGTEARAYQLLLLKVAGVPEFRLANQFNFSSLKQRIIMMNRMKSARINLLRFLFILPLMLVSLAACRTEIDSALKQSYLTSTNKKVVEFEYLAGILMDGETDRPIANLALKKTISQVIREDGKWHHNELVDVQETITTDKDGFYFWKIDVRDQPEGDFVYRLVAKDAKYKDLFLHVNHGKSLYSISSPFFDVKFLTDGHVRGMQSIFHVMSAKFPASIDDASEGNEVKKLLMQKLPEFSNEYRLIADFKKQYEKPAETITKFRNGYFDKERLLVGYEDETDFYLDGEKVEYQKINQEFSTKPIALLQHHFGKGALRGFNTIRGIGKTIVYLSFPVYKSPPPASLLTDKNVEWIDTAGLDLTTLRREPYMLDGFRQVAGAGSNLTPRKEDIRRIAIFKGDLARYYDRKLDKLWWIETRPVEEVMERPNFAAR